MRKVAVEMIGAVSHDRGCNVMGKQLLLAVLLCPVLAFARSPYDAYDPASQVWLGVGFGVGSITSVAPAPSAGRAALAGSIDAGYRLGPEWGLGFELGVVGPPSGCTGHHCTPTRPDFAPNFTRFFLIGEYRPNDSGVRMRAGAGVTNMCYRHYIGRSSEWEYLLDALFSDDHDSNTTSWQCKSLSALGASVSIGYQWSVPGSHSSVGLQLRGEAAHFAASARAGTPSFRHRALLVQVQLNLE